MPDTFYGRAGKRMLDATLAGAGLIFLAPILAVLVLIGFVAQGRPVFFLQTRIGRHGAPFTLWKFRTMALRRSADSTITTRNDPRVTPWGAFLRRFKLDELPQLYCVLRGDMSLVGPRPDVPGYWDEVAEEDRELLRLRPGITGPVSLIFRNEEALLSSVSDPESFNDDVLFPEKVRLTRKYAAELTLMSDLKWVCYTIMPERLLRVRLESDGWTTPVAQ